MSHELEPVIHGDVSVPLRTYAFDKVSRHYGLIAPADTLPAELEPEPAPSA